MKLVRKVGAEVVQAVVASRISCLSEGKEWPAQEEICKRVA